MKRIWILTLVFIISSCKGADLDQETLHVMVEGVLGSCNNDDCVNQLGGYEEKPYVWNVKFPRELQDLDPKDEGPIPAFGGSGYRIGRYEVSGLEYELKRLFSGTELGVDLNTPLHILVLDCTDEFRCGYKHDVVLIYVEDQDVLFSVFFYGNQGQKLTSDKIPSAEVLSRMSVTVDVSLKNSVGSVFDEAPASEVFSTLH